MAFDIRITTTTKRGKKIELEPAWWNIDELKNSYQFKSEINNSYQDYILTVDKQTFLDIIESQEKYRNKGLYQYEGWVKTNNKTKTKMDRLVLSLKKDSIIKIWIYEWESGFN